jgi:hypothetical protein
MLSHQRKFSNIVYITIHPSNIYIYIYVCVCGWRKLHNEELHGLYSSPSIVRVIKAKRMRWAGNVARMGGGEGCIQHFDWEA